MRKYKVIDKPTKVVDDIICHICGESQKMYDRPGGQFFNLGGLEDGRATGCYESRYLVDGILYRFTICEECLVKKVFSQFTIPPEEEDYLFGD